MTRPSWVAAVESIAVDLARRCPTEERFAEQWERLGTIVRYLATHEPSWVTPPPLEWGRWEWWRP